MIGNLGYMIGEQQKRICEDASSIIENLTTGAVGKFSSGDRWKINIHSCYPNVPIYLIMSFRDCKGTFVGEEDLAQSIWTGSTKWGNEVAANTDGNGNATLSGTFNDTQIGHWHIEINLGPVGIILPTMDFDVYGKDGTFLTKCGQVPQGKANYLNASNQAPANPEQYTVQSLTESANKVLEQARQTVNKNGVAQGNQMPTLPNLSTVGSSSIIGGFDLTTIGLVAGGLVVAFMLFGGSKHGR